MVITGCDSPPVAEVDGEQLIGAYDADTGVAAFLGVPFAEAPLGPLRWQAPQALRSKVARRAVNRFAPACMQSLRIHDWYQYMAETFGALPDVIDDLTVDEDCLYLNIWTPTITLDTPLPVMVYVHGGSNNSGWSYEQNYHGQALAERGVVVVSIAYRVGVFGFLSHPDLPPGSPVANFGLWDQLAALQWIQQHIGKFGGDPQRVTAFGESAGAGDILALMFAEPARGLFHRAILQSTAGFGLDDVPTLAGEQQRGVGLASALGVDGDDVVERLRAMPADVLLETYEEMFSTHYHSPAVDGQLIIEPTWNRIADSDFGAYEVIIGTNANEWYDTVGAGVSIADVERGANRLHHFDSEVALQAVAGESDPQYALDRLHTADEMLCPSQYLAAKLSGSDHDAWMYFFTRIREGDGGAKLGAYHGAEYIYVFDTHDAWMPTTDVDRELTETMSSYWIEFARNGNPNSSETPNWPLYKAPEFPVQELGDTVASVSAPEEELCRQFQIDQVSTASYRAASSSPVAQKKPAAATGSGNGWPEGIEDKLWSLLSEHPSLVFTSIQSVLCDATQCEVVFTGADPNPQFVDDFFELSHDALDPSWNVKQGSLSTREIAPGARAYVWTVSNEEVEWPVDSNDKSKDAVDAGE